jgi:hypothetical protein
VSKTGEVAGAKKRKENMYLVVWIPNYQFSFIWCSLEIKKANSFYLV